MATLSSAPDAVTQTLAVVDGYSFNPIAHVKHTYDCSSIEKIARIKRKNKIDRVERFMKQIMRLTEEERADLTNQIEAI